LPVFNEEKLISNCINSLLEQDYKDLEIIVVDDGSTDKTVSIVKEFITKNKNIVLLYQKHNGPGSARNLGAKKAKGSVLVFPDADEEFPKDYVRKLTFPILNKKTVGTIPKKVLLNKKSNIFSKIKYVEFSRKFNYVDNMGANIFRAISKKVFLDTGGFDNSADYFDDGSVSNKLSVLPLLIDVCSYTTMSSSPKEIIFDSAWGVKSNIQSGNYKPLIVGFALMIFYFIIILTSFQNLFFIIGWLFLLGIIGYWKTRILLSIFVYPVVFVSKSIGLFFGLFRGVFTQSKGR
jgi:glycosyltransferase involved in cell wall biosynthesis